MKRVLRMMAFVLSFILIFCTVGCSKNGDSNHLYTFDTELSFQPMTADGVETLMYNPDRGFRSEATFSLSSLAKLGTKEKITEAVYDKLTNYVFKLAEPTKVVNIGIGLTGYNKTERIPDEALTALQIICDTLRTKGYRQNLIFVYNGTHYVAWTTSEEARKNIESVCASEEIMLSHIEQLAPIISKNKDTVISIMGGFIGFSGDMAESSQYPPVDRNKIMKAIYDKLVVTNDIFYIVRSAEYINEFINSYDDVDQKKIGFVNKAMFGEQTKIGWNSGGYQKGNPEKTAIDWWEYVTDNSPYVMNDGEVFPNSNLIGKQSYPVARIPSGLDIIVECAHHNLTTMGFWNGYYEVGRNSEAVMLRWQEESITPEILEANNIVYDPAWFTEDDGGVAYHSAYEFIRDHLGYKLTAIDGKASSDGKKISVSMSLKNHGFSAAFNLESGFAILNSKYEPIAAAAVGEPDKWYSHNPEDETSTEVPVYSLSADLDAPQEKGKYYIAFYLKNDMGDGAQLSNRDMSFENGYNILCAIEI